MRKFTYLILMLVFAACSGNKKAEKKEVVGNEKQQVAVAKEELKPIEEVKDSEMILVSGGTYQVGSNDGMVNEQPAHKVTIKSFYIDKSPVTVAQFRKFIQATGYKTEAENYGDAGVFNFDAQQWQLIKGATWEYPFGPSGPKAENDHPVTQVSWTDAVQYAKWIGKRLPTELEWEIAAKSAKSPGTRFSWGDEVTIDGKYMSNVWQGNDIANATVEDGYMFTSPVGAFGTNELGLTDMGGNVWNWCADVFKPYEGSSMPYQINESVKVIKGGSFFFDQYGEQSYTTTGRFFNSSDTSLFNTGFRCAKDAE